MFTQADKRKLLDTINELNANEPTKIEQLEAITESGQARLELMEAIKDETDKLSGVLDELLKVSSDQRLIQTALADLQTVAWPRMADYIDVMRGNITEMQADINVIKSDMSLLRANLANMQEDVTAILNATKKP